MPFVAAIATWTASIRAFGGSAPVRSSVFARAPVPRPIDSTGIPVNSSNRRVAAVASPPPRFRQDRAAIQRDRSGFDVPTILA